MSDLIQDVIDVSLGSVGLRGKKKKKVGAAPIAPVTEEEDAQTSVDTLFSGAKKRRQIASTVQGGATKRQTLGNA